MQGFDSKTITLLLDILGQIAYLETPEDNEE